MAWLWYLLLIAVQLIGLLFTLLGSPFKHKTGVLSDGKLFCLEVVQGWPFVW